jgi:hypothetical protein
MGYQPVIESVKLANRSRQLPGKNHPGSESRIAAHKESKNDFITFTLFLQAKNTRCYRKIAISPARKGGIFFRVLCERNALSGENNNETRKGETIRVI